MVISLPGSPLQVHCCITFQKAVSTMAKWYLSTQFGPPRSLFPQLVHSAMPEFLNICIALPNDYFVISSDAGVLRLCMCIASTGGDIVRL